VEVERAADLYAEGWTLRQIGAELGIHSAAVSHQLDRAGVPMRRGGPPAHPTSKEQILELRDQGLTWTEVGRTGGNDCFGCIEPLPKGLPPMPPRLGRWQEILAEGAGPNLAIGVRAAVADRPRDEQAPQSCCRGHDV
jgi:hypothetical protein